MSRSEEFEGAVDSSKSQLKFVPIKGELTGKTIGWTSVDEFGGKPIRISTTTGKVTGTSYLVRHHLIPAPTGSRALRGSPQFSSLAAAKEWASRTFGAR